MHETQVCHINVARSYRGGERQTELLMRELSRRGISQSIVCRRAGALSRRLRDLPIEIREVSGNPLGVAMACGRAQLLHVHEGRSVYAAWIRHLLSGCPYVITRRVDNPIGRHRWAHKAYRNAVTVAAVAPQVAEIVRRYDPRINVTVVHSSASGLAATPAGVQALRERWPGRFLVGHVGALDNSQKGQEYIIDAAHLAAQKYPDLLFVLVGGGADESLLRELAGNLSNVTFTGFVENVGDFLGAFDVFILPSNREGIGSILLDAMQHRLPIVASRVGGVPDIVRDGVNGFLIERASPQQLLDAILKLRGDPDLREDMGTAGATVALDYTAEIMCDKYMQIYSEALGTPIGESEPSGT